MMTGRRQYSLIYTTLLVFIVALSISFFTIQQSLAATNDIATQLTVLKKLQDDGVINQEEFNQAKDILLNKDKAKDKSSQSEATTKTVSLTEETKPKKKKTIGDAVTEDLQINQINKVVSKKQWEKMEIIYKGYRIYTSRPGTIKIKRISDNKQLLVITGDMKVKHYNNSEGLFDIKIQKFDRPTMQDDLLSGVKEIEKTLKNPAKKLKDALTPKILKKKDKTEAKAERPEIKLELRIDGKKLLYWEGRYVPKYKALFYQIFTSGYQPFHFYVVIRGKTEIALNMKIFNKKIDIAVRKAKERLADEYDLTLAQIDGIIERETGKATEGAAEEAAESAVEDAVAAEVQEAVAQTVGDAMSEEFVTSIEEATGEAIDDALEAELAAAIDETIAMAVDAGISEAAAEAGIQAFLDTLAAGGSEADAIAAADAACQAVDSNC